MPSSRMASASWYRSARSSVCAGFVPELTVARVLLLQLPSDPHGIIEASLAVVEQQQRELGICLREPWICGRLFDHPQAAFLVAAKPHDVGHQTHRHRQRRHDVAIGADNQPGILPRRIHLQHLLVRVIRATVRHGNDDRILPSTVAP